MKVISSCVHVKGPSRVWTLKGVGVPAALPPLLHPIPGRIPPCVRENLQSAVSQSSGATMCKMAKKSKSIYS